MNPFERIVDSAMGLARAVNVDSASGEELDRVAALLGMKRLPARDPKLVETSAAARASLRAKRHASAVAQLNAKVKEKKP